MTFRANMGKGRHGWLRLTPAYGVRLVRDRINGLPAKSVIVDPFSGTGTTGLAAAELGYVGHGFDINPFLVWLGNAKAYDYSENEITEAVRLGETIVGRAKHVAVDVSELWQPNIFRIDKWWNVSRLNALKVLRYGIDLTEGPIRNLLDVAFCRTLIATSSAAFNHQSMSFQSQSRESTLFDIDSYDEVGSLFLQDLKNVTESARYHLRGSADVTLHDARETGLAVESADLVLTSPPYVNRMSYIRELRPYMYWLRFLGSGSEAGELDWTAIGGTWGSATSKLNSWFPQGETPVEDKLDAISSAIRIDGGKNGSTLANYVVKYHHDMWEHFKAVSKVVKDGGFVRYIIGNSTFYGHEVPAQAFFAEMLKALGYTEIRTDIIRKRNSNKALFEYEVSGRRS